VTVYSYTCYPNAGKCSILSHIFYYLLPHIKFLIKYAPMNIQLLVTPIPMHSHPKQQPTTSPSPIITCFVAML
jgi:hypothetical protein